MWDSILERASIHHYIIAAKGEREAIQAPGSRAIQVLAIDIVVRTMTGALEAHAVITEWYGAAQVNTTLIQRNPERTILIFDEQFIR